MKCNVGQKDRMLRVVVGLIVVLAGVLFESPWGLVGIVPLLTGLIRWCPAYVPFSISTNK